MRETFLPRGDSHGTDENLYEFSENKNKTNEEKVKKCDGLNEGDAFYVPLEKLINFLEWKKVFHRKSSPFS